MKYKSGRPKVGKTGSWVGVGVSVSVGVRVFKRRGLGGNFNAAEEFMLSKERNVSEGLKRLK